MARMNAPNPWLQWAVTLALAVAGPLLTVGSRLEVLVTETRRNDAQDVRLTALEASRGDVAVALGELRVELRHHRQTLDELRDLLRGGMTRR